MDLMQRGLEGKSEKFISLDFDCFFFCFFVCLFVHPFMFLFFLCRCLFLDREVILQNVIVVVACVSSMAEQI